MKSQTKILAEVLAEKTFYDLDEMSNIIETYFKIWQSEQLNSELYSNDIVKRRNYLLSQKSQVEVQRNAIEKQLQIAKTRLRYGKYADQEKISKMTFMIQTKKNQLTAIQNDLANLKSYEKAKNIKESKIIEREVKKKVFELIEKENGKKYAERIFTEAEKLVAK